MASPPNIPRGKRGNKPPRLSFAVMMCVFKRAKGGVDEPGWAFLPVAGIADVNFIVDMRGKRLAYHECWSYELLYLEGKLEMTTWMREIATAQERRRLENMRARRLEQIAKNRARRKR